MRTPHPSDRARGALARAPLPVLHLNLWGHFYPALGVGDLSLYRWEDTGTDDMRERMLHQERFGPWGSEIVLRRFAAGWAYHYARLTQWTTLVDEFDDPWHDGGAA